MKNFLIALIVVAVIGGGYLWMQNKNSAPESASTDVSPDVSGIPDGAVMEDGVGVDVGADVSINTPTSATITYYNGTGFSPSEVTIKKGGTVHWVNNSDGEMWVASAQHPSHTAYSGTTRQEHCPDTSGTAFDQCASGNSYSFTFGKTGTWGFHNHVNSSAWGKVIVE